MVKLAVKALVLLGVAVDGLDASKVHGQSHEHHHHQLRRGRHGGPVPVDPEGFVHALQFKHSLRVCNAFPDSSELSIYRGKTEQLTADSSMPYKTCRDFAAHMKPGDKLDFRIGETSEGTFSVSDLPNNDAVLLLVVHRHDTLSTAVAFDSHVFAMTDTAQVAVIDAYRGVQRATPKISDAATPSAAPEAARGAVTVTAARSEDLRFDSVVAVNPGVYEIALGAPDGVLKARHQLVAVKRESYVVIRTGVEAQQGSSYPEELIVFPNPPPAVLHSGAARRGLPPMWAALASALVAALYAATA